jgi:magnesium-transporting ATPase (P-type)
MSPAQKSEIVKIVKNRGNWITMSVGDGANDVSMLKEASVGIGIYGKEGSQAILASDFALSQFSHLQRLLFVHGRYAYSRVSTFTLFYFYTDYMLQICEIWLAFFTGFSGQIYYLDWIPSTYNIFVMSLPTMASFALDRDLKPSLCLKYINLYSAGQKGAFFSMRLFWSWIAWTVVGATIIFWIPVASYENGSGDDGREASLFWRSSISYILLVAAVNWKLLIITRSWNFIYA